MFSYSILSCSRFYVRMLSRSLCSKGISSLKKPIGITFIKGKERITVEAKEGQSVYDAVVNNNLDLGTFGECSGQTSCSTCHVIVNEDDYKSIKELSEVEEKEADLLDNAYSACSTSRLACQIIVTGAMNGLELSLPGEVKDARLLSSTYTSEKIK